MTDKPKHGGWRSPTQTRKGVPNKANAAIRERIENEADPLGFLISIQNGNPIPKFNEDGDVQGHEIPTLEQKIYAAKELLKKYIPDLKAVSIDGGVNGSPILFQVNTTVAPPNSQPQQVEHKQAKELPEDLQILSLTPEVTKTVTLKVVESDD